MKHLTVIQHTAPEWLGHLEDHFEGRGIRFGYHRPFANGGVLPSVQTLGDGLVLVGGGDFGAATPGHLLPTLDAEVRLVRACLMLEKPVLALGLGAQILSLAADGKVDPAPLRLTAEQVTRRSPAALGGLMPEAFPLVAYLRDAPVLPAYATLLAADKTGGPAAFQIGRNAFGFAGHIGVRRAMIEELVMDADPPVEDAATRLEDIGRLGPAIEDALVPLMAGLLRAWEFGG